MSSLQTAPLSVHLAEGALTDVLLVSAFEEADPEGSLLSRSERERATREASDHLASDEELDEKELARFFEARARPLRAELDRRVPLIRRLFSSRAPHRTPAILVALFVTGLATNFLGAHKRIHVVANPLMALMLWNLALFALLLVWHLGGLDFVGVWVRRLGALGLPGRRLLATRGQSDLVRSALARFAKSQVSCAGALYLHRGRRLLHLGAMALVLGALGGLYLRGLVLAYETTWESTFLTREGTERALGVLFAPASHMTGIAVPALETPGGDAAAWIHLYAVTVLLVVLIPRAILATLEGRHARSLAKAIPLPISGGYFRRLSAAHQGKGLEVALVPYSHELARETREALLELLHDVFGARAGVRSRRDVAYGAEVDEVLDAVGAAGAAPRIVLVFGLAQTPETEVHGRLIADLHRRDASAPALLIVDGTGYRERLGGGETAERRVAERARSWDRVLHDAGGAALHFDPGRTAPEELIEAAGAMLEKRGLER